MIFTGIRVLTGQTSLFLSEVALYRLLKVGVDIVVS